MVAWWCALKVRILLSLITRPGPCCFLWSNGCFPCLCTSCCQKTLAGLAEGGSSEAREDRCSGWWSGEVQQQQLNETMWTQRHGLSHCCF